MPVDYTRRSAIAATLFAACVPVARAKDDLVPRLRAIEADSGGRLGFCASNTLPGLRAGYRQNERFPMCSTFKLLASALALNRADKGLERLDRHIVYPSADLPNSPITKLHIGGEGMTVQQLCHAAMTASDNTAANLLLASFGGPAAITAFARSLGDTMTRLDRVETSLNEARAGDPRDTTTPQAMAGNLRHLLLGHALTPESRAAALLDERE